MGIAYFELVTSIGSLNLFTADEERQMDEEQIELLPEMVREKKDNRRSDVRRRRRCVVASTILL